MPKSAETIYQLFVLLPLAAVFIRDYAVAMRDLVHGARENRLAPLVLRARRVGAALLAGFAVFLAARLAAGTLDPFSDGLCAAALLNWNWRLRRVAGHFACGSVGRGSRKAS